MRVPIVKPSCWRKLLFHSIQSTKKRQCFFILRVSMKQPRKVTVYLWSSKWSLNFKLLLEYCLTGNRKSFFMILFMKKTHIKTIFPQHYFRHSIDIEWSRQAVSQSLYCKVNTFSGCVNNFGHESFLPNEQIVKLYIVTQLRSFFDSPPVILYTSSFTLIEPHMFSEPSL